ncbi:putative membrane protein [Stella humosa]|uniref:Putative membrane protein n=1 Tax=Stella humosa TaxID=94 RepID=A0A3N1MFK0_9PROT|nr:DUF1345 domain-containing protein [Stella humosa]ROQ01915.1 putative membrane protein [Stella humosa]BBK32304.1 membrane protein [Stella humosa]
MIAGTGVHFRHHGRFYAAGLCAIGVWAATGGLDPALRFVLAGDVLFGIYLLLTALFAVRATPDDIREKAEYEDEGIIVIVLLTLAAIGLSLGAIFSLLGRSGPVAPLDLTLSIAGVLLGWLTLHTIAAFRYAHLYYRDAGPPGGPRVDRGGFAFPATPEPVIWDFLYHAFVIGMTAQVSDVQVETTGLRRLVLAHGVLSFLFNTVLLALAVNIAAGQVR